jgi:hypothetical protein
MWPTIQDADPNMTPITEDEAPLQQLNKVHLSYFRLKQQSTTLWLELETKRQIEDSQIRTLVENINPIV